MPWSWSQVASRGDGSTIASTRQMTAAINSHLDDPGPEHGDAIPDGVGGPLGHREVDNQLLGALFPLHIPGDQESLVTGDMIHQYLSGDPSNVGLYQIFISPLLRPYECEVGGDVGEERLPEPGRSRSHGDTLGSEEDHQTPECYQEFVSTDSRPSGVRPLCPLQRGQCHNVCGSSSANQRPAVCQC